MQIVVTVRTDRENIKDMDNIKDIVQEGEIKSVDYYKGNMANSQDFYYPINAGLEQEVKQTLESSDIKFNDADLCKIAERIMDDDSVWQHIFDSVADEATNLGLM